MYLNLEAELKRKNIKRSDIANHFGWAPSTVSTKMQRKSEFSLGEAQEIKNWLNINMPLEDLFFYAEPAKNKEASL